MKEIIGLNINKIKVGQFYLPYKERLQTIKELKEKYPRAYKKYKESNKK